MGCILSKLPEADLSGQLIFFHLKNKHLSFLPHTPQSSWKKPQNPPSFPGYHTHLCYSLLKSLEKKYCKGLPAHSKLHHCRTNLEAAVTANIIKPCSVAPVLTMGHSIYFATQQKTAQEIPTQWTRKHLGLSSAIHWIILNCLWQFPAR